MSKNLDDVLEKTQFIITKVPKKVKIESIKTDLLNKINSMKEA